MPAFREAPIVMQIKWFRIDIVDNWSGPEQYLGGDSMP